MSLVKLLLAPDKYEGPHALARRMGIQEIIWDCSYWGIWDNHFRPYSVCYSKTGKKKKQVDATEAHLDHLHIGFTNKVANGKTTFWKRYKKH